MNLLIRVRIKKREHKDKVLSNLLLLKNLTNFLFFFLQFLYICTPCIWNAQSGARLWEWHHSEHPLAWLMGVLNHEDTSNKNDMLYIGYVWISFSRSDTCGILKVWCWRQPKKDTYCKSTENIVVIWRLYERTRYYKVTPVIHVTLDELWYREELFCILWCYCCYYYIICRNMFVLNNPPCFS